MESSAGEHRILIAGLGNVLLMDDGMGVHAVWELQKEPPADARVVEIGTAVLHALDELEWAEKIVVIDAVEAGGAPGTVYVFDGEHAQETGRHVSLHELNLMSALRFLPPDHPRPQIAVVGVEPQAIDYGLELSPAVQAALRDVVSTVRALVECWKRDPDCRCIEEVAETRVAR